MFEGFLEEAAGSPGGGSNEQKDGGSLQGGSQGTREKLTKANGMKENRIGPSDASLFSAPGCVAYTPGF